MTAPKSTPGPMRAAEAGSGTARPDDPIAIRHYRPGDEAGIISLFEATFGRPMGRQESARHWSWEFRSNPTEKIEILLAESGAQLAAQYAVLPLAVEYDGARRMAALSLDTATHPDFRGRGLFTKLARQLYDELAAQGYAAVFGFPNAASAPIFFSKLGWVELSPFPLLIKPTGAAIRRVLATRGALARVAGPFASALWSALGRRVAAFPRTLEVERARTFPDESDAFWERARFGKTMCVVRDRRYLDWRYVQNPDSVYDIHLVRERGRLVGSLVTLVEDRFGMKSGFIMDLLAEESRPDVASALVSLAEISTREAGAELVSSLMYPGTVARRALRSAGFLPVPKRLLPQAIHFGARVLADTGGQQRLLSPTSWYITWGDSDVL